MRGGNHGGGRPAGAVYPFRAWRNRLSLSIPEAAPLIGRDERQLQSYDKMAEVPHVIRMAMAALEHLPAWHLHDLGIDPYWRARRPERR